MVYGLRVLGYRVLGIGLASFRPFRVDRVWNFGRGPCVGSDALQIGNEVVRFMVFGLRLPHCTTRANPGTPDLSCLHDMICSAASVAAGGSNKLSSKLAVSLFPKPYKSKSKMSSLPGQHAALQTQPH